MPTHRPTLILAVGALVLFGLLPLAVMAWRITGDMGALGRIIDGRTISLIGRTAMLGTGVAGFALLVGVPFGYMVARTDLPGRSLWAPLAWVPLLLPPLVLAMSWTVLAPLRGAPMTIWILGLGHFPLVATFVAKAARRIDRRQVEAARLVGGWSAQWRMEWPLIAPAAVLGATLAFVFAINDFAVPDYVSSVGPKFNVYADEVFATWQVDQKDAEAVSTALPLIALTLCALTLALVMRRRGSLASLASGFERPPILRLGRAKWPALVFALGLISVSVFLPVGQLLNEAGTGEDGWSLGHTGSAFSMALERCRDNLRASILLAAGAATLAVPVALAIGHGAARLKRGKWLLAACILPFAAPAILFGIGQISVWNHPATQSFYTGDGLVIAMLLGRYLIFPVLVLTSAVENLSPRLEEAAAMVGVSPLARLFRIVALPILPALAGAWTLVFVFAMRELDAAILVPAANKTVMFRLYNAVHFYRQDYVAALALVTLFVIMIPGLLWSLFARKKMDVLS
ncbi:MAG: ABC transporter permease subunit [Planctomycetota bacterium]|nr:ABC transporter permease subunit [Planctomycetota bacterium]